VAKNLSRKCDSAVPPTCMHCPLCGTVCHADQQHLLYLSSLRLFLISIERVCRRQTIGCRSLGAVLAFIPSAKWPGVGKSSRRRASRIRAHKDEPRALLEAHFEERAAIFELDEDLPRPEAEAMARQEMAAGIRKRAQAEHDATTDTSAVAALRAKCPAYVPDERWRGAIAEATTFISKWGAQAHPVPERPAANYDRLARFDGMGLIWRLRGRPVIALQRGCHALRRDADVPQTQQAVRRRRRGAPENWGN
jgi:hypothetical protein